MDNKTTFRSNSMEKLSKHKRNLDKGMVRIPKMFHSRFFFDNHYLLLPSQCCIFLFHRPRNFKYQQIFNQYKRYFCEDLCKRWVFYRMVRFMCVLEKPWRRFGEPIRSKVRIFIPENLIENYGIMIEVLFVDQCH